MKKKIPDYLEDQILERSGKNESSDEIALWLLKDYGIDVSGRRVRAWIEERRREREPFAKAAIARAVASHVAKDLYAFEDLIAKAQRQYRKANSEGLVNAAIRALLAEAKIRTARLKLSGGGNGSGSPASPNKPVPQKVVYFPVEPKK